MNDPASTRPPTPRHASCGSNRFAASTDACSTVGVCHRPAQRPRSLRRSRTKPRAPRMTSVSQCTVGRAARATTAGMRSMVPSRRATQRDRHGHAWQLGARGVQTSAPSSINPSFSRDGDDAPSTRSCAVDHSQSWAGRADGSSARPWTRSSTRATLPSTIGARSPWTMLAIAPAVYRPTPGNIASSVARSGTLPPNRVTHALAASCNRRARR